MSAVENNSSFRTATKKHENHSEAIDLTVNRGSLKETEEKEKKKKKKKQYDFVFKMDVIVQVESGIPFIDVAFNNNIDKLLVSWWIQNKK